MSSKRMKGNLFSRHEHRKNHPENEQPPGAYVAPIERQIRLGAAVLCKISEGRKGVGHVRVTARGDQRYHPIFKKILVST
jgi:hypothetical protein